MSDLNGKNHINQSPMKTFTLLLIASLFSLSVFSQKKKAAEFYINSQKIDLNKTYINPRNVDSISKDTEIGAIYIYTKENKKSFSPLVEVLKKNSNYKHIRPSMIFRINNKTIYDIENITIDPTFYVYIEIDQAGQLDYLSKKHKDLLIVNISLEEEARKPEIRIRGTESPGNPIELESTVKELLPHD